MVGPMRAAEFLPHARNPAKNSAIGAPARMYIEVSNWWLCQNDACPVPIGENRGGSASGRTQFLTELPTITQVLEDGVLRAVEANNARHDAAPDP